MSVRQKGSNQLNSLI